MNVYAISEMDKFCIALKKEAINCLSCEEDKTIDCFITNPQCIDIIERLCYFKDEDGIIYINEDSYTEIVLEIAEQIYQSALSKLAANDLIQCAWDEDENKMIFWVHDEHGIKEIKNELT